MKTECLSSLCSCTPQVLSEPPIRNEGTGGNNSFLETFLPPPVLAYYSIHLYDKYLVRYKLHLFSA